jgi:hypothetical protein
MTQPINNNGMVMLMKRRGVMVMALLQLKVSSIK